MSVSLNTLEKLKTQLQQVKDLGTPIKADLYTHLTEVFNRIMLHHPESAYDKFEEVSGIVKQTNYKIEDPKKASEINQESGVIKNEHYFAQIKLAKDLLDEVHYLVEGEDQAYIRKESTCAIQNFIEHANWLEYAGIGFGE